MRYIGRDGVARCLAMIDPVAEVRRGLLAHADGRTVLPAEYGLRWTAPGGGPARSLGLPAAVAVDDDLAVGVKIINANPANVARGRPRASGVVALFDPETAEIRTLMDGALVSATRTAAVSALAVDLVGSPTIERALVVGAGVLAEHHIDVLAARCPSLRRIDLTDLDRGRAEDLARRARRHGPEVAVVDRPGDVSRDAQLIVTATTTTTPYLGRDDVVAGATVVNVSLDDLDSDLLLGADRLVVDDWELVRSDGHRRLGRLAQAGAVVGPDDPDDGRPRVDAELASIVSGGRPGRVAPEDVVVVNPFGMAVSDIAVAHAVARVAEAEGLVTEL